MKSPKILITYLLFLSCSIAFPAHAEQIDLKHFTSGSYQQLLNEYANKPFVLLIWSINCTSCKKRCHYLVSFEKKCRILT